MRSALPLSGVVITFNEADRIERCLRSIAPLCAELIVVDSGSTDDTRARAAALGARVIEQPWLGYAAQKNFAIAAAREPWVLLLDADEWLEPAAGEALRELFESPAEARADVFTLQRRTHFLGTAMEHGSFSREPVERLFRGHCRYQLQAVHERLDTHGLRVLASTLRMEHDTARDLAGYWSKLERYAGLWAEERRERVRRVPPGRASLAAIAYLLKNLLLRLGVLDGPAAWRFHALHARYAALKYRLLRRLLQQR